MEFREDVEMDLEDSMPEKEKEKQKRAEGGVSPDPKRARLEEEIYDAQIPADEEMEPTRISHLAEKEKEVDEDEYEDESADDGKDDDGNDDDDGNGNDDDDDDDEEDEEKMVPQTGEVVMTEEEKQWMLDMKQMLMDTYGTTDRAEIDCIISKAMRDLWGAEEEWDEDKDKDKDKDKETEDDENVLEILKNVDSKSACIGDVTCRSGNVPDVESFLLYPWEDRECTRDEMTVRSLDIYYKRLFPNVESARELYHHCRWNRLPEVDFQYVQLFNKLNTLFEQKSMASYLRTASSYEFTKAKEIAKDLNLQKLRDDDISQCAHDVFLERDTIAEHKLGTDYDLFLLECQLDQNMSPGDFTPDDPSEISCSGRFSRRMRQWSFKKWMDEEKLLEKSKEECERLIRQRQAKNLKEYCSTRIRYVKFKRALAKDLKLISEDTD